MIFKARYANAVKTLESYEAWAAQDDNKDFDTVSGYLASAEDARRTIELYERVYLNLEQSDIDRMKSFPIFSSDYRPLKDIKEKYGLSNNELKDIVESVRSEHTALNYNDQYQKENIRRVVVKVNRKTNPDIAEHLDRIDNVQGYILDLIRKDITAAD